MTQQQNDNDEHNYLLRMNEELQKRRAKAKAEAMAELGDILVETKRYLSDGAFEMARRSADQLRETMLFGDVVELFYQFKETFGCNSCGKRMEGLAFRKDSLTWIRPHLCGDCEQKIQAQEKAKRARSYRNFVEYNLENILKMIGVEELLLDASYNDFPEEIIEQCRRSFSGKHGIYAFGEVGVGKSWLAVAYLKELIWDLNVSKQPADQRLNFIPDFRQLFRFIYVPSLLAEIKNTYDKNNDETEKQIISEYTRIPVLVLDDLATETPNAWVRERLNTIIYYRDARKLKTIYTSNMGLDELSERLDERITSRIRQHCEIINLTGPDRRRL